MEKFKALVNNAVNYLGQANQSQTEEDRNEIIELATTHPELVDSFFQTVPTTPKWTTLVESGEVAYFIDRIRYMKISESEKKAMQPKIEPMVWGGGSAGKIAVIKVTL